MENKAGLREKFAYGLTDTAAYMVWVAVSYFLMFFYTDVFGLSAGAVGMLFLVSRIWDAANDPVMGLIIDKTSSRHGKCRPYFLWLAIPFAAVTALTFYTPNLGQAGKLIYAYITYNLLGMIFTGITIPITAILPRLTNDIQERTVFGTFRMVGASLGSMAVLIVLKPLYENIGGGNLQRGFFLSMSLFGVIAALLFLFAFYNLKEKATATVKKQKLSDCFKALKNNKPWAIVFLVGFLAQVNLTTGNGSLIYYLTYNVGRPELYSILGMLAFSGVFIIMSVPLIAKRIGKRNTMISGYSLSLAGSAVLFLFGEAVPFLFVGNLLYIFGMSLASLTYVLISDTVDYTEWKTGIKAEGFLSSFSSFGIKLGTSVGGALSAWLLAYGGYAGNAAAQTESALSMIRVNFALIPSVCSLLCIVLLCFYNLDREMPKIISELNRS